MSDESDYQIKRRNKKKSYRKKDHIKLYAKLMAKFLKAAYKSKIIRFKLDAQATNTSNGITKNAGKKSTYQRNRSHTHHRQTHHRANLIFLMTANTGNIKARDAIKRKSVGNAQNRTRQTYRRATLICPTKVIIKSRDAIRRRATGKRTISNYMQN